MVKRVRKPLAKRKPKPEWILPITIFGNTLGEVRRTINDYIKLYGKDATLIAKARQPERPNVEFFLELTR